MINILRTVYSFTTTKWNQSGVVLDEPNSYNGVPRSVFNIH